MIERTVPRQHRHLVQNIDHGELMTLVTFTALNNSLNAYTLHMKYVLKIDFISLFTLLQ